MVPKKGNESNLLLLVGSLVIAVIIWVIVFNASDSVVNASKAVEIQTVNENAMTDNKLDYELLTKSVEVSYKVRSQDIGRVGASDFKAYVDLSQVSKSGAAEVYVDVLNGKDSYIADIECKPSVISISTEDIQTVSIGIDTVVSGEAKTNYSVDTVETGDSTVNITGPASEIGRISKADVTIDVNKISSDITGTQKLVFKDSNNNVVDLASLNKVTSDISETSYKVTVAETKEIELHATIKGKPAEGMIYTSYTLNPTKIKVIGAPDKVDGIETIEIGDFDITGKQETYTADVNVSNILPEGVMLASASGQVKLTVNIAEIEIPTVTETESTESSTESETKESESLTGPTVGTEESTAEHKE